jgi:thymidylate synthase
MYVPIDPQSTNVQGWLNAALTVKERGGEAHNVVIDIADPLVESETDAAIIREVDAFLRGHHRNTLSGVANTIFPQRTYERHGPEAFYGVYRDTVLPRMKQMTRDWGRYFDRLTAWRKVRGSEVTIINPLDDLVQFMKTQIASDRTYRNAYEMTVFDPARDAGKVSNRQCLSFLSFKLTHENQLLLTAMYRNHAYIARGLGNFIGLGRLMAFVAEQSGATIGSLTCISTHAEIDHGRNTRDGVVEGWTHAEANALLSRCQVLNTSAEAA